MELVIPLYRSYIAPFTTRIGVHNWLSKHFWRLKLAYHPGIKNYQINDTKVRFKITTQSEYNRFHSLVNERSLISNLLNEMNNDDVVYDIGANVGMYTCFIASKLPPKQTIAFEPHPENARQLRVNLEMNNRDATITQKALSDQSGTAELAVMSDDAGEGEHSLAKDGDKETIEVESAVGDDLVKSEEFPVPSILKIDVEGAELSVLKGLRETLKSECRLVYCEVHPEKLDAFGATESDVQGFLESCGFDVNIIHDRGGEYFIKAINQ